MDTENATLEDPMYEPTPEQVVAERELEEAVEAFERDRDRADASRKVVHERARRLDELGVPKTRIAEKAKIERSYLYAEVLKG